jgi:hypothetical protein
MSITTVNSVVNSYTSQLNVVVKDVPKPGLDYAAPAGETIPVNFPIRAIALKLY